MYHARMKSLFGLRNGPARSFAWACLGVVLGLVGCASTPPKEPPVHERGWLGGEYRLARRPGFFRAGGGIDVLPAGLDCGHQAGLVATVLSTNTPAARAGLLAGDLVVELDHQPIRGLREAYARIDHASPGQILPVAVWRAGSLTNLSVVLGREKYQQKGVLSVALPPLFRELDLWSGKGFSLVALGYEPEAVGRAQLDSVANQYRRAAGAKAEAENTEWRAWAAIFQVWRTKSIMAQEVVASAGAAPAVQP